MLHYMEYYSRQIIKSALATKINKQLKINSHKLLYLLKYRQIAADFMHNEKKIIFIIPRYELRKRLNYQKNDNLILLKIALQFFYQLPVPHLLNGHKKSN